MTRVVVAHDEARVRRAVRRRLEATGRLDVVAEAATGAEAMVALRRHHPQLAIVDLHMTDLDGLAALPWLRASSPATQILVYSEHTSYVTSRAAVTLGALAVVDRSAGLGELASAALAVA